MPLIKGKDKEGCYWKWGKMGFKYHFACDNANEDKEAKKKAINQGVAIGEFKPNKNIPI